MVHRRNPKCLVSQLSAVCKRKMQQRPLCSLHNLCLKWITQSTLVHQTWCSSSSASSAASLVCPGSHAISTLAFGQ